MDDDKNIYCSDKTDRKSFTEPSVLRPCCGTASVKSNVRTSCGSESDLQGYSHRGWGSASLDSLKFRESWRKEGIKLAERNRNANPEYSSNKAAEGRTALPRHKGEHVLHTWNTCCDWSPQPWNRNGHFQNTLHWNFLLPPEEFHSKTASTPPQLI